MKILIDGRLMTDKQTGISRYTEELLKIYILLFGSENIILIIDKKLEKKFEGIKVIRTNFYPFNLLHFVKFYEFLKTIEFDIYHSMFYSNSFFKIKNKIYITTIHDLMYKLVPNFFYENKLLNKLSIMYFDFIVRRSLKNSDFIISVSKATQSDLLKIYNRNSIVITEGFNTLDSNDGKLEIDENIIQSNKYFLYVGNKRPHKNIDFLKKCYLNSYTGKKLVIVGHRGINISVNKKEIIYTGYINDHTLKYLYENASAFVFPSLYEGFGLPILESINCNTLVFSSNYGSLKEFGEYNIKYFDPNKEEELIELMNNIDRFKSDINKKNELLSKYNWKIVEEQLNNFYKENIYVEN